MTPTEEVRKESTLSHRCCGRWRKEDAWATAGNTAAVTVRAAPIAPFLPKIWSPNIENNIVIG
jgi:hypothetical protein